MNKAISNIWNRYGIFVILLLVIALFGALSPKYFLTTDNLVQIMLQSAITIIISMGEFFAILIAGIDLSIGSILALSGMITAKMLVGGYPIIISILVGIIIGALLGAFNGLLINLTGLHPFIITLGTQAIYRGITLIISNAKSVFGFPTEFTMGIAGWIGKIPIPVIIALIVVGIMLFITKKTIMGRNIYALGGNKQASWFSGINTNLYTVIVFIISGICSGLAGIVMTARLGAAEPLAGVGIETFAIASCVIGGTSFFGGKGSILGAMMGALIIGVISNGLNILNVSTYYQQIVMGALIIVAVAIDKIFNPRK